MDKFCKGKAIDQGDETLYELFAISVHIGTLNMGHYIAFTKREGTWYLFNDEDYQKTTETDALNQEAYLLFYKKVCM